MSRDREGCAGREHRREQPRHVRERCRARDDPESVRLGGGKDQREHGRHVADRARVSRDTDYRDDDVVDDDRHTEQRIHARARERHDRLYREQNEHDRPEPRHRLNRSSVHERRVGYRDDERRNEQ